jgi:hypothetical protein
MTTSADPNPGSSGAVPTSPRHRRKSSLTSPTLPKKPTYDPWPARTQALPCLQNRAQNFFKLFADIDWERDDEIPENLSEVLLEEYGIGRETLLMQKVELLQSTLFKIFIAN